MVRAAVDALDEALDGDPGPDLKALDSHQGARIDQRPLQGVTDRRAVALEPEARLLFKCGHQ